MRRAALLLIAASARGMIVQRVSTSDHAELAFVSSAGGAHVFLHGVDLGSAFAPPTVRIGTYGHIECAVQPFTSTKNRIHCIIQSDNLPAPTSRYDPRGQFVSLPLRVTKGGRHAECWHVGFVNHGCFARFDVGATPRVLRVFTPTVESAGALRLGGEGIDGGLRGAPALAATLYRGATPVLGVCGEKDCQASNMGAETLGCYSRPGAGGDGVSGKTQATQLAVAYSDATHFGCALDALAGGLTGGFFNVSLHGLTDPQHRGDAYVGFSSEPVTVAQSLLKTDASCSLSSAWNQSVSFASTRRSEKTRRHSCSHSRSTSCAPSTVLGVPCVMPWKTLERSRRLNV